MTFNANSISRAVAVVVVKWPTLALGTPMASKISASPLGRLGSPKLGVIQDVEELSPELHVKVL
jgi:hypothetical protein